jgi:hypothetical protein
MWYKHSIAEGSGSGALAAAFRLSSSDEQQSPPHLSVFEQSLTTNQQARDITGKDLTLRLPIADIRGLVNADYPDHRLDACWFQAMILQGTELVPDCRPGTEGHCGIIGLSRPAMVPRPKWKWFCVRLADIAHSHGPVSVA